MSKDKEKQVKSTAALQVLF